MFYCERLNYGHTLFLVVRL